MSVSFADRCDTMIVFNTPSRFLITPIASSLIVLLAIISLSASRSATTSLSAQRDASLLAHYGDILWALGESFMAETYWQKAVTQGYDKEAMEAHIAEIKASTENEKRKKR